MRRILKKIAAGDKNVGDTTTLAEAPVVDVLREQAAAQT